MPHLTRPCGDAARAPVPHAGKCVSDSLTCRWRGGPGCSNDI